MSKRRKKKRKAFQQRHERTGWRAHRVLEELGPPCPRCDTPTEVRVHKTISPRHLAQPFYYSRWYHCNNQQCQTTLIMPPEHRVFQPGQEGAP